MSTLLWRASRRHLLRHPAQCLLAIAGIALGVAIVIGILLTEASARRAFADAVATVTGKASHQVVAVDGGDFAEDVLADVRVHAPTLAPSPSFSGTVTYQDGERHIVLQMLGIDPLSGSLHAGRDGSTVGLALMREPGAVLLSTSTATRLRLTPGASFVVRSAAGTTRLRLLATVDTDAGALLADDIALVDLATAQETLGAAGRLSRITLTAPDDTAVAPLRAVLPPALMVVDSGRAARSAAALTSAFYTNLDALSLLALLVGGFMIYNTVAFLVMQRRPLFARLRALGVTREALAWLVAGEALALGLAGGVVGVALGAGIARALMAPLGQTLRDHYNGNAAAVLAVPPWLAALGVTLAAATTLVAALQPAWTARNTPPAVSLRYSHAARTAQRGQRGAAWAGTACAVLAVLLLALSSRSLYAGFAALGAVILAAMLAVPWLVQRLLDLLATRGPWLRHLPLRLALRGAARALGRIGTAVSALMAATAVSIGVGLMVASFRGSVDDWLAQLLRADFYVSPGTDEQAPPALDADMVDALAALPGVAAVSQVRRLAVMRADDDLRIIAYALPPAARRGFRFLAGDAEALWARWDRDDVAMVSEPFAWRHHVAVGDRLRLPTPNGERAFEVGGIYRDYGAEQGVVAISLARYRHHWDDERVTGAGIYVEPGTDRDTLRTALAARLPPSAGLGVWSNADLRARSLAVFDRTFAVTDVLTLFAALIAALGVFNALLALHLERGREYAVMRALGSGPALLRGMLYTQTLVVATLATVLAVPLGLAIAALLIEVINIRSFGWSMEFHLQARALVWPAAGAIVAALAATVYPAERAVAVDPAGALRDE